MISPQTLSPFGGTFSRGDLRQPAAARRIVLDPSLQLPPEAGEPPAAAACIITPAPPAARTPGEGGLDRSGGGGRECAGVGSVEIAAGLRTWSKVLYGYLPRGTRGSCRPPPAAALGCRDETNIDKTYLY